MFPDIKFFFLLDPEMIFLDHRSFFATPLPLFKVYQSWQRELEAQPNNLIFTSNATIGGNIVAHSLNIHTGDEVPATDHEYGEMDRTW